MLQVDSRKIQKGDTFIALKSAVRDGHDFIEAAILNGASEIIAEHGNYSVKTTIVPNTRDYLANYLKEKYHNELKDIKFVGITGTNGKTTSAFFIYSLLNKLGSSTCYIGTLGFYLYDKNNKDNPHLIKELKNTTPELFELYEMFVEAIKHGVKNIIMEVSSHALELKRVLGLEFDIVSFTNLTQDHLDVHGSFENYKKAKLMLFDMVKDNGLAIVNVDDKYGKDFILEKNKTVTYGFTSNDYKIVDYELKINKSHFAFEINNKKYDITIPIPGKYNIFNYLLTLIVIEYLGYSLEEIIASSNLLETPKGRFDIVNYNDNVIVVDYAHTPDAVLNILNSVKEYKEGNVITIIGCGGDRDRTKRPIMGKFAVENSDYVIFTNDNPRTEDEKQIMNDIVSSLEEENYLIIYDRKKAIEEGIKMLTKKDILLILGKGHEDYQLVGKEILYHDDKEYVKEVISNL